MKKIYLLISIIMGFLMIPLIITTTSVFLSQYSDPLDSQVIGTDIQITYNELVAPSRNILTPNLETATQVDTNTYRWVDGILNLEYNINTHVFKLTGEGNTTSAYSYFENMVFDKTSSERFYLFLYKINFNSISDNNKLYLFPLNPISMQNTPNYSRSSTSGGITSFHIYSSSVNTFDVNSIYEFKMMMIETPLLINFASDIELIFQPPTNTPNTNDIPSDMTGDDIITSFNHFTENYTGTSVGSLNPLIPILLSLLSIIFITSIIIYFSNEIKIND